MTWLSEIMDEFEPPNCPIVARQHANRMARVIRELRGYVIFLESYCSDRMSPEKARRRFQLPPDAKELLE